MTTTDRGVIERPAPAAAASPIAIDGAALEGGGQIVRVAAALSAATRVPVTIREIRANRPRPGLAAQHLAGLDLVRRMCDGTFDGDVRVGSTTATLRPGRGGAVDDTGDDDDDDPSIVDRDDLSRPERSDDENGPEIVFEASVGTAGAVTLVAQAAIPCATFVFSEALDAGKRVRLRLRGGTDVPFAPPLDYLSRVFAETLLRACGAIVAVDVKRRGFYPRGGGEVDVTIERCPASRCWCSSESCPASRCSRPSLLPLEPIVVGERERRRKIRLSVDVVAPRRWIAARGPGDGDARERDRFRREIFDAAIDAVVDASGEPRDAFVGLDLDAREERARFEEWEGDDVVGGAVTLRARADPDVTLGASTPFEPPRDKTQNRKKAKAGEKTEEEEEEEEEETDAKRAFIELAKRTGERLGASLRAGAGVDANALDQLVVFMALARGTSRVVAASPISLHALTAMDVASKATGATFRVIEGRERERERERDDAGAGERKRKSDDDGAPSPGLVAVECDGVGAGGRRLRDGSSSSLVESLINKSS